MALPATGVWEIETGGSDSNGGMFDPSVASAGTDYTQGAGQTTFTYTDLVIGVTTTQATSVVRAFIAADVGNTIQITSGTGFTTGFFNIRSVAAGVATFDRSLGTTASTGGTGILGGSMASPGTIGAVVVAGNIIFWKAATYTITSTTPNVSNGLVQPGSGGGTVPINWIGYSTNRNQTNTDTAPVLTTSLGLSNNFLFGTNTSNQNNLHNIIFDGASKTGVGGLQLRNQCRVSRCIFRNCTWTAGLLLNNGTSLATMCVATGNSVVSFSSGSAHLFVACEAYANTATGFDAGDGSTTITCINCLSYGNTGATTDGFGPAGQGGFAFCVAYGNGRNGFGGGGQFGGITVYDNCLAEANTGVGFVTLANGQFVRFISCGAYNNSGGIFTSGATPPTQCNTGFITNTTGSFFVAAVTANFALNNTTNQGALARAAGYPSSYPRGLTNAYYDSGGAQSQAVTGGLLVNPGMSGGMRG